MEYTDKHWGTVAEGKVLTMDVVLREAGVGADFDVLYHE